MKNEIKIPERLFTVHGKEIEEILRRAVQQALWRHKQLGQSVAAWQDGKVVIVPPEEIPVEDDFNGKPLSRQERKAKDIEIINRNADRLNEEAMDVLDYQIDLQDEVKDGI